MRGEERRRFFLLPDAIVEAGEAAMAAANHCYYCGQCSETCPRQAEPGELMMATRRWLTSRYDGTGLSRRLYLGARWQVGMLLTVALAVLLLFVVPADFGFRLLLRHPEARATVMLEHFAPRDVVPFGKWAHLLYRPLAAGLAAAAISAPRPARA
jgi:ferredoxin